MSASSKLKPFKIIVLISGGGSNLQSIIDNRLSSTPDIEISAVISNKPDAYGLQRAQQSGIKTAVISHRNYASREAFDQALITEIDQYQPDLIVLAGFMRLLTTEFVNHYAGKLINIHPSLLPLYPGLNTHQRALDNGDKHAGASVHFVTPEVDGGPVILQAKVEVHPSDTSADLANRVLQQEHLIYPRVIQWMSQERLSIENNRVLLDGKISLEQQCIQNEI